MKNGWRYEECLKRRYVMKVTSMGRQQWQKGIGDELPGDHATADPPIFPPLLTEELLGRKRFSAGFTSPLDDE